MTIISDQPSRVMHWNTLSRAQKILSKLVTSLLGLSVILPQKYPSGHPEDPQIICSPSSSSKGKPSKTLMQRYLSRPVSKLSPPMAKMRKKKNRTIRVFCMTGIAEMTDATTILSPSILFTKRRGLRTRKARRPASEAPPPPTTSR